MAHAYLGKTRCSDAAGATHTSGAGGAGAGVGGGGIWNAWLGPFLEVLLMVKFGL